MKNQKSNYTPPKLDNLLIKKDCGILAGLSFVGNFDEFIIDGGDAEYVGDVFLR